MLRVTTAFRLALRPALRLALRLIMAFTLAPWSAAMAQLIPGVPSSTGNNNGNGGGNGANNSGATNATGGSTSASTRSATSSTPDTSKLVFLSGRVLTSDGNLPAEGVAVQRVCGVSVTAQTQTDSKGRFTLQIGGNRLTVTDASSGPLRAGDSNGNATGRASNTAASAWGCDVRAVLQGYRSDTVSLNDRHSLDDPNIGTILLHPLAPQKGQGLSLSATSGLAPKPARQDYEKGLAALRRNSPDKAQKDFARAVELYPRFAVAWFELGQTYERRAHTTEAREAYTKAVAADANYVSPYERLYLLDMLEGHWQQAANTSEKVLRLDPIHFPRAYYFNALANAHLQNLAAAEKSAREATRLEGPAADPKAHYILGLVLASKGNFTAAAESLRTFLKTAAEGPEQKVANRILAMIETREAAQK
jgi:tetratricopeptide (TPR) repeat protein